MVPLEIVTPGKVRKLQRTLYQKATDNRMWRAWSLYADLCRLDVLHQAAEQVVRNKGSAGIDGMSIEAIKPKGDRQIFVEQLRDELLKKCYTVSSVLRVSIPKANGKRRYLGIPTVKDRVVQTALRLLLEPIFEADMHQHSYGYRPKKTAHDALGSIKDALFAGNTEVIDADLSSYFDTIPHNQLIGCIKRRVSDGSILQLIRDLLKAPVYEGRESKRNERGTPQGGVISPLLANIYLNDLDHQVNGVAGGGARMIRYADDMVILCRKGQAGKLLQRLEVYMGKKGLTLNENKTRLIDFTKGSFCFLGFQFSRRRSVRTQKWYPHVEPSCEARKRLRDSIRQELNHWTRWKSSTVVVKRVNSIARGWSNYFHYGQCTATFHQQNLWLFQRYRDWLWKKHKRKNSRKTHFNYERVHGLYRLYELPLASPSSCNR